jgi:hypothetical protein
MPQKAVNLDDTLQTNSDSSKIKKSSIKTVSTGNNKGKKKIVRMRVPGEEDQPDTLEEVDVTADVTMEEDDKQEED